MIKQDFDLVGIDVVEPLVVILSVVDPWSLSGVHRHTRRMIESILTRWLRKGETRKRCNKVVYFSVFV